jgi:hypothetical protein
MLIKRCSWHPRRLTAYRAVVRWRPLTRVQVTDGLCARCAGRVRAELVARKAKGA